MTTFIVLLILTIVVLALVVAGVLRFRRTPDRVEIVVETRKFQNAAARLMQRTSDRGKRHHRTCEETQDHSSRK